MNRSDHWMNSTAMTIFWLIWFLIITPLALGGALLGYW